MDCDVDRMIRRNAWGKHSECSCGTRNSKPSIEAKVACLNGALQHFYGAGDDPTKFATTVVRSLLRASLASSHNPSRTLDMALKMFGVAASHLTPAVNVAFNQEGFHALLAHLPAA